MTTQAKTSKAREAKPETIEDTVANAAKASSEAVQDGLDKAMRSAGEFGDHIKANTEALVESLAIAGKGVEAINHEVSTYTKSSLENGVATAQAIASAKSLQEMVELQTEFVKSSMDAYLAGLTTLTGMGTVLLKDAAKPINDRTQASIAMVQGYR